MRFRNVMYVILELDVDTQGMIQSIGNGYKPTRQTTHNATALSGYKRADRIKFGKSHLIHAFVIDLLTPHMPPLSTASH